MYIYGVERQLQQYVVTEQNYPNAGSRKSTGSGVKLTGPSP